VEVNEVGVNEDTVESNKINKSKNGLKLKNIGLQDNNCFNINQK